MTPNVVPICTEIVFKFHSRANVNLKIMCNFITVISNQAVRTVIVNSSNHILIKF